MQVICIIINVLNNAFSLAGQIFFHYLCKRPERNHNLKDNWLNEGAERPLFFIGSYQELICYTFLSSSWLSLSSYCLSTHH